MIDETTRNLLERLDIQHQLTSRPHGGVAKSPESTIYSEAHTLILELLAERDALQEQVDLALGVAI